MTGAAIAGITLGSFFFLVGIVIVVLLIIKCFCTKSREKKQEPKEAKV